MDNISTEKRSTVMGRIRGKDTKPELIVRSLLHSKGFRYRLHVKCLPGKPDLVFPKLKKVIFVNGCFWHRHKHCKFCYTPKSNQTFWNDKFAKTMMRDQAVLQDILHLKWSPLVVWECETTDLSSLWEKLRVFLERTPQT